MIINKILAKLQAIYRERIRQEIFYEKDIYKNDGIDPEIRKKYYKKGFSTANITTFNLENNNPDEYFSDWHRYFKATHINREYRILFYDKMVFHNYFRHFAKIVQPIAYFHEGSIIDFHSQEKIKIDQLLENINTDLIIKPATGKQGIDVLKINLSDNNRQGLREKLQEIMKSNNTFVIQEAIKQSGFSHEIYPHSVNTIRFVVMKDPDTNKFFIAGAIQRFGTSISKHVDNWSAGGMIITIDTEKGIYKKGAINPQGNTLKWISAHPDTQVHFEGQKITNWNNITQKILEVSEKTIPFRYIGWDVIPMENDFLILEANNNPDMDLLQLEKGLFTNPKIKKFYKFHDVI